MLVHPSDGLSHACDEHTEQICEKPHICTAFQSILMYRLVFFLISVQ